MSILRIEEIREMMPGEREEKLKELEARLAVDSVKAKKALLGEEPNMIREIRRAIARIKTVQQEETQG